MNEASMTIIMLAMFLIAMASGVPVAFGLGGVATVCTFLFLNPKYAYAMVSTSLTIMDNFVLIAVPLFLFMAMLLDKSEIIGDLFETAYKWSGPLRGGLAGAVVIVCTVFAACTGIVAGAIVGMGIIALPIMLRYKTNKDMALGSILAGGTLGQLIPPSVVIIIYASITNVSIGRMFAAGITCGLILSALYLLYIFTRSYLQKDLCPALPPEERASWREKILILRMTIFPILIIVGVLGSIFSGAATPTEAAAVGVVGSALCAVAKRKLTWSVVKGATAATIKTTGMIGWILLGAVFFGSVLNAIGGGALIENLIAAIPGGGLGALIFMIALLLLLGMVIEVTAIIIVAGPIFAPIALHFGFDSTWFGILFVVMLQTGYISPPFGWSLFFLKGVVPPDISMGDIYHSAWAFLGLQLVGVTLFVAFPEMVLWFPNLILPPG